MHLALVWFTRRGVLASPLNMPGRIKGSKNRKTLERERAKKLASVRAELAKNAPPIDYAAAYDSLDIMEKVMRRFYLLIEEKMGVEADWKAADSRSSRRWQLRRRWRVTSMPNSRPSVSPATSTPP
jgi:hypothetical protein